MSYKIRYGSDIYSRNPVKGQLLMQSAAAGALLLLCGLILLGDNGKRLLYDLVSELPVNAAERAVYALSNSLARGEGWYRALVVWCREIIDAGAV